MNWYKVMKAYGWAVLLVVAFYTAIYIRNPNERRPDDEG